MDLSSLLISLGVDGSALTAGIESALSSLSTFASQAGAAGRRAGQQLSDGFRQGNAALEQNFQQLDQLTGGYERLGSTIQSAGQSLTQYVTLPILAVGAASIKTAGDVEALEKGFAATYQGSEDLGVALAKVKELAKLPSLGLEEAIQGATNLQAAGLSADLATRSLQAVGNALATVGKGKADLQGVTDVFSKMSASGKVTERDILELSRRIPQLRQAMQEAFNVGDAAGIKKLGLDTTTFIEGITQQLAKLPQVTGGIKNDLENFGDDVKTALDTVGESLAKDLNVEGLLGSLGTFLKDLAADFAALDPGTRKFIEGLAGAAAVAGPLLVAVGGVIAVLPALEAGFATLGVTSLAALAPILPIAAAVAAVALVIYENWDSIISYFKGPGAEALSGVADSLGGLVDAVGGVVDAYDGLLAQLGLVDSATAKSSGSLGQLIAATSIFRKVFEELATGISAFADTISSLLNFVADAAHGNFAKMEADAEGFFEAISRPLRELLGLANKVNNMSLSKFLATQGKQAELFAPGGSADFGDEGGYFGPDPSKHLGLLEKLRAELKAVKEAREKATSPTEVAQDNARIARIQAEIDALEGKNKALSELAKIYADIKGTLAGVDTRVRIGVELETDGLDEKIKVLEEGIKKVTDLKVSVNDARLVALSAQLTSLVAKKQQLDAALGEKLEPLVIVTNVDTAVLDKVRKDLVEQEETLKIKLALDGDQAAFDQGLAQAKAGAVQKLADAGVNPNRPEARQLGQDAKLAKAQDLDDSSVRKYSDALKEAAVSEKLFGESFNEPAENANALSDRIRDLYKELETAPTPEFADKIKAEVDKALPELQKLKQEAKWDDVNNQVGQAAAQAIAQTAELLGTQIGEVISGNETAGEALQAGLQGVLKIFGGFLVKLGEALVTYGGLMLAADILGSDPLTAPAAIAVGLAAIAAGALLSAISSGGPKGGANGGGSYGGTTGASVGASAGSSYQATKGQNLNINVSFQPVELRAQGADLRAVMQVDKYRLTTHR